MNRVYHELRRGPIQARVYNDANISIATSGTRQFLTFNSERYDTGTFHSTSSNTGRLTAPTAGLYSIGCSVEFASNATGYREVLLRINGATFIAGQRWPAVNGNTTIVCVETEYQLARGEYVEVGVVQNSGGALNVATDANFSPEFWIVRLGSQA